MSNKSYVVYEGDEDWSALYIDGKLDKVSDHYLIDERIREHFNVTTIQSDAFLLGNENANYKDVASTLAQIEEFENKETEIKSEANRLREEARILIAQAEALEK